MKRTKLLRACLVACLTTALIAGLAVLYTKTRSVDAQKKIEVEGYLKQLKQVDAEWNVDVLKSRMEINKNYDPLTGPLVTLLALQTRLEAEATAIAHPGTGQALTKLKGVIDEKIDLVDQFKSQNSILKNSLRYVPTAVDELRAQIRDYARVLPASREALDVLDRRVNQALNDVLKYNLLPETETADKIEAELNEIESADDSYPTVIASSIRNLTTHTRTILRQRVVENDVIARISAMPMTQAIDELGQVFDHDFEAALSESDRYRNYLLAYSSLLLVLLVYIGSRLFRTYRIIARVNKELKHANETLEHRVRERTEELSTALVNLKESEGQLVQSEKMASLGQMVAGVAHEINTPLAYVRSSLETVEVTMSTQVREFVDSAVSLITAMRSGSASDEEIAAKFAVASALADSLGEYAVTDEIQNLLKDAVHGVDEISKIVVNLKNFSRLDRGQMTMCTVDDCLESTLQIAKSLLKGKAVRRIAAPTAPISCAPSQINQVFLNLITNAAQATPDLGGRITIVSRMQGTDHVAVDVLDNGVGIADDVLPRIFDPFFTTKPVGKGTGLGLSIVYKIVERHGGQIKVHTREGVGTKLTVVLPVKAEGEACTVTSLESNHAIPAAA